MSVDVEKLRAQFPQLAFTVQESLAPYTYMKVGGKAECFVIIQKRDDLFSLCSFCFKEHIPFVVLGGASNTVIPDEGIGKLVIRNQTSTITISKMSENAYEVTADSGVITSVLANRTIEQELTGLEYFVGVPGTVGGAIINNSHFTANELIGAVVDRVEVCTVAGEHEVWPVDTLKFDYDYSVFHERGDIILSATFFLHKGEPAQIAQRVKEVAQKRVDTQPLGVPSSGCMYRNPQVSAEEFGNIQKKVAIPDTVYHLRPDGKYQIAAGFLIDKAGLKGQQVGGVKVSEKHATYMINTGGGTSADVAALCQKVEETVKNTFGVQLEREVFFL